MLVKSGNELRVGHEDTSDAKKQIDVAKFYSLGWVRCGELPRKRKNQRAAQYSQDQNALRQAGFGGGGRDRGEKRKQHVCAPANEPQSEGRSAIGSMKKVESADQGHGDARPKEPNARGETGCGQPKCGEHVQGADA